MKKGEKRRADILRVAEELFYAKGYDATTIQDILNILELSKGGFYHHFESKEQLLETLCGAKIQEAADAGREEAAAYGGAVDRLNVLLDRSAVWRAEYADFLGVLIRVAYRDNNVLMRDVFARTCREALLPLLEEVVQEGMRAGEFSVQSAQGSARLLMTLLCSLNDDIARLMLSCVDFPPSASAVLELLELYRQAAERMLEAPYGTVVIFQMGRLVSSCQAVWQKHARALRTLP